MVLRTTTNSETGGCARPTVKRVWGPTVKRAGKTGKPATESSPAQGASYPPTVKRELKTGGDLSANSETGRGEAQETGELAQQWNGKEGTEN